MKKSEFKRLVKESVREALKEKSASPAIDLTTKEKSVAKYIQDNLSTFEKLARDPNALKSRLESDMKDLHVSDQYKRKFFDQLAQQRTPTARLMFLSNAMLKGAGLGAI